MIYIKKGARLKSFLFLVGALFVFMLFLVCFKDVFLSPQERFEIAQQADFKREYKKAEKYYLLATYKENETIQKLAWYYLGLLYKKQDAFGVKNINKSVKYLEKSAEKGLPQAQYELALLYETGDKIPENQEKAISYMKRAAVQDFVPAQYGLAVWIERGYVSDMTEKEAFSYYEKAAEQGYLPAQKGLALIYKMGGLGVQKDEEKAAFWFQKVSK